MKASWKVTLPLLILALIGIGYSLIRGNIPSPEAAAEQNTTPLAPFDRQIRHNASHMLKEGRHIFRFDTFGDEAFWGDQLQLHQALATASPKTVLALGLKVDVAALPPALLDQLQQGTVNLDDPAVTLALLKLNAVVGVTGFFSGDSLQSMGIQCALCHSTVDTSVSAPGIPAGNIGQRLDGWANRDLNIGAITALAPNLAPFTTLLKIVDASLTDDDVRAVLRSWGPGKFDAELALDGKTMNPHTGASAATLIPPAFGLAGVNNHTWTGAWGTVPYWNAFVANLEMHGQGTFFDPRLDNADQFPIAAAMGLGHLRHDPDLITPKLPALHFYQLAIPAPKPPPGSFDAAAAARGGALFSGKADCARCHVEPITSEPGWNLHTGNEICIDNFQADRAPDRRYRTSPLNGLWTHQKGGFFHDGRFPTLPDVVNHYDQCFSLGLTDQEKLDLVQYLLSLPNEG
jgi:cytochrome c553